MSAGGFDGIGVCGMSFSPSALTSAPVSTASTPGMARAAVVSIDADAGMGVRRAQHKGIGLAGQADVVAIAAAAGEEAQVLLASKWLSDGLGHGGGSISS